MQNFNIHTDGRTDIGTTFYAAYFFGHLRNKWHVPYSCLPNILRTDPDVNYTPLDILHMFTIFGGDGNQFPSKGPDLV